MLIVISSIFSEIKRAEARVIDCIFAYSLFDWGYCITNPFHSVERKRPALKPLVHSILCTHKTWLERKIS